MQLVLNFISKLGNVINLILIFLLFKKRKETLHTKLLIFFVQVFFIQCTSLTYIKVLWTAYYITFFWQLL
jgi:hypothetical protein